MRAVSLCLAALGAATTFALPARAVAAPLPPAGPDPAAACCTVTIRARVPARTGTVYLAGSLPELGPWRPDGRAMGGTGRERTVRLTVPPGTTLQYQFTLGDWQSQGLGPDGKVPPNYRVAVRRDTEVVNDIPAFKQTVAQDIADWRGSGVVGRLVYWTHVRSAYLDSARDVEIWLPPGYERSRARYPVLYMSDGQNLFDPRLSYTGVDWGVDSVVTALVRRHVIPPIIVVGVWNTAERMREYSPWQKAPDYARFLIRELMPRVNREFRTLTGPRHTAVMGSSMGGLLSFYLVTHHPDVFGACGCMSTPFQLSPALVAQLSPGNPRGVTPDTTPYLARDIAAGLKAPRGVRYWIDFGSEGLDSTFGPETEVVRRWLLSQGLVQGRDFVVREYAGATHNEAAWRARLADPLTFLFGKWPR